MKKQRLEVNIRPATQQDTTAMLELTGHIWGGHDYVPEVWHMWLDDPYGRLVVAESQGRMAAIGRLARLSPDEWWLQGLRVHPDFEGRGVASQIHDYLVDEWRGLGGTLRLSTGSDRLPVQHLCERTGFSKVGEFSFFTAPAILAGDSPLGDFSPMSLEDATRGLECIRNSPTFSLQHGLWELGWEWMRPSQDLLAEAVQRGLVFWWRNRDGLLVCRIDEEEDMPGPYIQHLACHLEDISTCLEDFRRLASRLGYGYAGWVAPLQPLLLDALAQAGFERSWDGSIFLYAQEQTPQGLSQRQIEV